LRRQLGKGFWGFRQVEPLRETMSRNSVGISQPVRRDATGMPRFLL
jgi:hypothetical protein